MMKSNNFRPTLNALENRSLMSVSPLAIAAPMPAPEPLVANYYRQYLGRVANATAEESTASGHVKVFSGKDGVEIRSVAPEPQAYKIELVDILISSAQGDTAALKIELENVLISSAQPTATGRGQGAGKPSFSDLSATPTEPAFAGSGHGSLGGGKVSLSDLSAVPTTGSAEFGSRAGSGILKIG